MKCTQVGTMLAVLIALAFTPAAKAITIEVVPALAPNGSGSPSFSGWEANAIYALEHGLAAYGNPNLPTYYHAGAAYNSAEVVVTGFPSWMGQVDPGTVFGPAFAAELGNRMHFGLIIDGEGEQFSISELSLTGTSNDPYDGLAFSFPDGYSYGSGYVGVLVGADGLLWTADDEYYTGPDSTYLVDGLVGRGSGNSYAAYCSPCSVEEQQLALLQAAWYPGVPYTFTATYSLVDSTGTVLESGSASYDIDPVPEPAALSHLALGLIVIAALSIFRYRLN